ncbi:MAG: nucleoside triphosphate pyrophosphohydrolase, partial [Treponema sp.]|nr:nucleoside triphosphate pyrophosphohydrolase [Treponema sp.]
ISFMHEEEKKFSVADVLTKVNEKLIRRHPHVFGDVKVKDTAEILNNWETIKIEQEGRKPKESILDEVSAALPPMERSFKLQKKASKVGFDWQDTEGVIEKIKEEFNEVQAEIKKNENAIYGVPGNNDTLEKNGTCYHKLEEELGDLLFSVINLCRFLKVEPSAALRRTNSKFIDRFKYVEKKMKEAGQEMKKENLCIMDKYWNEAKEI